MKSFNYYQPTEISFGPGRLKELGDITARLGKRAVLVTVRESGSQAGLFRRARDYLEKAGLSVAHFDGVIPNPTTETVSAGAAMAKAHGADVIVGLGGGSSMDTAKAIAVEAVHPGSAWDYLFYKKAPTSATLPVVAVSTTSGTGSQVTPCAVITKTDEKDKSAIWHPAIFPKAALVDPELMLTLPRGVTAMTGFDAFAHNFEAFISNGTNPFVEALALDALRLIAKALPACVADGSDLEARTELAWADTLGGLAISSAGVTLPHGLGMQISGHCPQVAHGQSLALTYPEFTRFTMPSACAKFAAVGRILDPGLARARDEEAAVGCCAAIDELLKSIGLYLGFDSLGIGPEEIERIAEDGQVLPDYKNNPRVATLAEMRELLLRCAQR